MEIYPEHFGISVQDLSESVQWYTKIFGFEIVREYEKAEFEVKACVMKLDQITIELLEPYHPAERPGRPHSLKALLQRPGANHYAISVEDAAFTYNSMKEKGVEMLTDLINGRLFFCLDPDNTPWEVKEKQ